MKIGFDAKRLFLNNTGLGNYSRTLVRNLQFYFPEHQYFLFTPAIVCNSETQYFVDNPDFQIITPGSKSVFWRQWGINDDIKNLGLDIYHGLSHELPFGQKPGRTKHLVTIHDLIFELYPQYYSYTDRKLYSFKYRKSAEKADHIVSISENTANDVSKIWSIPRSKITTVYQACHPIIIEQERSQTEKKHFLYVGSITERKNLVNVIKALQLFPPDERKPLVVIGSGREYRVKVESLINELNLFSWVTFTGQVDNDQLVDYYDSAIALLYPSQYEGFGIPIIECAFRKTPVITSLSSSMPEAGGPHTFYVNPEDETELYNQMNFIIKNQKLVRERVKKTYKYVKNVFEPSMLSEKMISLYKKVVEDQDFL